MDVWFKTVLLFVVFNNVHLYRQLMNTTCLELAKPSNKHLRLSCNDSSIYHCLLNGDSTNELEICKMWKWIPGGNCAYLNEYGGNIDARRCSSSAELACPKTLYRSDETIKYAACYVKKNTNTRARQVRNTTCLELAKPSNQHFRLSCNNIGTYHCLLDQNYTKEFEICTMWKWITKGKCAYFSMYSGNNIDERDCTSSSYFVCPEQEYQSENTTNYPACYIRNDPTAIRPLTSLSPVASNWSSLDGNGGNATSSRISETEGKHSQYWHALSTILGILVPPVSVAVIYFILKYVPLYRKDKLKNILHVSVCSSRFSTVCPFFKTSFWKALHTFLGLKKAEDNGSVDFDHKLYRNTAESQESSDRGRNNDITEQQPFLRPSSEVEDTSESAPTMRHEDENINGAKMNVYHVERHESSKRVKNEDAVEPFLGNIEMDITSENSSTMKNEDEDNLSRARWNDDEKHEENDGRSADSTPGFCSDSEKLENEREDEEEQTNVFGDTVESLLRITLPSDEQGKELCSELYNLLDTEGLKLTKRVMTTAITRKTGKSLKILLNSLTDQEKIKLKEMLPEESYRILDSKTEQDTSIHVLYGLHRIFLGDEHSPKSGWGNPVREKDIGIGDDVERLYRIQTIVRGISNPVTMSVENYIRLLDIMIEAFIRLDPGAELKEDFKHLSCKLESIKNPNLTQTMLKKLQIL